MIPPRIKSIKVLNDFCIEITYVTKEKKVFDMKNKLSLSCYKDLNNIAYFNMAKSAQTTIEWPNGEDIDPNDLYNNSIAIN